MLPSNLHGPCKTIGYAGAATVSDFLERNAERYPQLDRDFIVEICFEHADRFDELFPRFDVHSHAAVRVRRKAGWLLENVRYDDDEPVTFHLGRFQMLMRRGETADEVLGPMLANGTWHFPPVIIESNFARSIGAPRHIGTPYYLVEGTHRLSYLHGLVQRGMIGAETEHDVLEVRGLEVKDDAWFDAE